ncbi:hypothetical protein PV08_04639 [Exophiala spinifera]|uniref:NAD(P)-binding domain-containing protein n=1 Tax=Exophiala spinifera TaxID=91928 RepID=A0A0D2BFS0_9EURO|nr:uncharacterized protein PV08_04639 [Exophiala spinifera]KIW17445.1 hypothetical protein PV08_04639 [Exophiala spinifera]
MVHLILTGATGLVGSAVLSHILSLPASATPRITRLSILSRNTDISLLSDSPPAGTPRTNKHTTIEVIEHKDFTRYPPELLRRLEGADACIWALGVSQNDVSKDKYVEITKDYTLNAAKAFAGLRTGGGGGNSDDNNNESTTSAGGKMFKFIYVSGEGATQTPGRLTPLFGRVKGETETALLDLARDKDFRGKLAVYSARPAGVDGTNQPWIWNKILRDHRSTAQRVMFKSLLGPMRVLGRESWLSPTEELGRVLVDMALSDKVDGYEGTGVAGEEGRILGNIALRRLAREGTVKAN